MEQQHSIKELERQVADIEGKMREQAKKLRELREEIAERKSDIKVGDTITWKFGNGRRKGIVMTVLVGGNYRVRGIKKDGTDGALQKAYSWDDIKCEKAAA